MKKVLSCFAIFLCVASAPASDKKPIGPTTLQVIDNWTGLPVTNGETLNDQSLDISVDVTNNGARPCFEYETVTYGWQHAGSGSFYNLPQPETPQLLTADGGEFAQRYTSPLGGNITITITVSAVCTSITGAGGNVLTFYNFYLR
jgi:hypothetical protein